MWVASAGRCEYKVTQKMDNKAGWILALTCLIVGARFHSWSGRKEVLRA